MKNRLFLQIDNAPLIIFRIFFGFLLACETFGAIVTGWVKSNLVDVKFTFSHIGMEWLQPLPGYGMYFYFAAMGVLGLLVMAGYKYRFTLGAFTILWAGVYFMQKTSYNNHYYLLLLVCIIMLFLPANKYASLDAKQNPAIKQYTMPAWCSWVMIAQVAIVYFYATLAKFYPDWLDGTFTQLMLERKISGIIHSEGTREALYLFIAYAGIAFDLLIVPLLLFRKTRTIAFIASLVFHIFNSISLEIGIFPFFALSFVVFFYPPDKIKKLFFRNKPVAETAGQPTTEGMAVLKYFFIPFFILQLLLPLRHYLIKGDVLWTEEGHRLSWRMMLRQRYGSTHFKVVDKKTGQAYRYEPLFVLTQKQKRGMETKPDMIWQMAQRIKQEYKAKGMDVAVYADSFASVNRDHLKRLIDPKADLAQAKWDYFFHCDWILLYDEHGNIIK
jgi:hypothetical protein